MYCKQCGAENDDNAYKCTACGAPLHEGAVQQPTEVIPNYLAQSIIVTLLCCLPLGIPAIVFAAQVNSKVQAGDIAGALDSSKKAKMFCWISFGLGAAGALLYVLVMVLAAVSSASGY